MKIPLESPEEPESISRRIHKIEQKIQNSICALIASGGLMCTSGSLSVLALVIQHDDVAMMLAGSCVFSIGAMKHFLFSIQTHEEQKIHIIESYFRR